jgi:hypothetical protein
MSYSYDRTEEERDRQRNNENGDYYPTPKLAQSRRHHCRLMLKIYVSGRGARC